MKGLYKYPHAPFPYTELVTENQRRGPNDAEYELLDTGVFDARRYGRVRVFGSAGFLVTVMAAGAWFEHRGMQDFPAWTLLTIAALFRCWSKCLCWNR